WRSRQSVAGCAGPGTRPCHCLWRVAICSAPSLRRGHGPSSRAEACSGSLGDQPGRGCARRVAPPALYFKWPADQNEVTITRGWHGPCVTDMLNDVPSHHVVRSRTVPVQLSPSGVIMSPTDGTSRVSARRFAGAARVLRTLALVML